MLNTILGHNLVKGKEKIFTSNLNAEIIGLYFSAHWCPPCRAYTPQLIKRYGQIKTKQKSFEIVFVSLDKDSSSYSLYYGSMPWLSIPYESKHIIDDLSQRFTIQGIPALIIINCNGNIKEKDGREKIMDDNFINSFPMYIDISNENIDDVLNRFIMDKKSTQQFKKNSLLTLCTVLSNISNNPGNPKYLTLKKSNDAVQTKLGHPDLIKILKHAGFLEKSENYDITDTLNYSKLKEITDLLCEVLNSLDAK